MKTDHVVVLITVPSREIGEEIARALLDRRLVACVNMLAGIDSLYWWQDMIQRDQEVLLVAKSRADLIENGIIPTVYALHPYEIPEIIALPILGGSQAYLDWIDKELRLENDL